MSGEVLRDGWCGEPIAWARVGDPVVGREWTQHGWVAVTDRLSPAEAVRQYGPITELVVGRNGGFESVTYGETKFVSRFVDPRGTGLYDDTVVVVHDPARDDYECPVCQAAPGEQCVNKKQQPCGTHSKRSQGRSRWEIERADAAARKAREEAEAAEQWQREMATPPALGAVLEVKRWMLTDHTGSDVADRYTVERTYANRTVEATADSGERSVPGPQRVHRRLARHLWPADIDAPAMPGRRCWRAVQGTTQARVAPARGLAVGLTRS